MVLASELRIGNLYESTDGSGFIKATAKDLYAWESGTIYGKPIPLTEEWLLKFGFEFDIFYQKHTNGKICIYWVNGIHLISWCKSHREDILRYNYPKTVHQLQNLYHALTGEELKFDL